MLPLTQKIFSPFLQIPDKNNRYFPTFLLSIISANVLGGIYWWDTHNALYLLIPLLTILLKVGHITTSLPFFLIAIYCALSEYNFTTLHLELLGHHSSLSMHIQDIHYHEQKQLYKITAQTILPYSNKRATVAIFSKTNPAASLGNIVEYKNILFTEINNVSYKKYLLKEGIHGTSYISTKPEIIGHKETITIRCKKALSLLEHKIAHKLSTKTSTLFSSLFLGSKKYIEAGDNSIQVLFNRWGINHFLARSGLHVTLVLFLITCLGRICLLPYRYLNILTGALLCVYSVLSYISTSFLRALLSALGAVFCLVYEIPLNRLHVLTLTSIIILIYNPYLALFLDFQLTFLLTWGLCITSLLDF